MNSRVYIYVFIFSYQLRYYINVLSLCKEKKNPRVLTLASDEMVTQVPDLKSKLLDAIRLSISLGVSFGPLANGVCLENLQDIIYNTFQEVEETKTTMRLKTVHTLITSCIAEHLKTKYHRRHHNLDVSVPLEPRNWPYSKGSSTNHSQRVAALQNQNHKCVSPLVKHFH